MKGPLHVVVAGSIHTKEIVILEQLDDLEIGILLALPGSVGALYRAPGNETRGVGMLALVG